VSFTPAFRDRTPSPRNEEPFTVGSPDSCPPFGGGWVGGSFGPQILGIFFWNVYVPGLLLIGSTVLSSLSSPPGLISTRRRSFPNIFLPAPSKSLNLRMWTMTLQMRRTLSSPTFRARIFSNRMASRFFFFFAICGSFLVTKSLP